MNAWSAPSIGAPTLKWLSLRRHMSQGHTAANLMSTSLLKPMLSHRAPYLEVLVLSPGEAAALAKLVRGCDWREAHGCACDLRALELSLASSHEVAARGDVFFLFRRRGIQVKAVVGSLHGPPSGALRVVTGPDVTLAPTAN